MNLVYDSTSETYKFAHKIIPKFEKPVEITDDEYKFTDIIIRKNGKIISRKKKSTWMSVSKGGLIYVSYDKGRFYFFLDKINKDQLIIDDECQKNKKFQFNYEGTWERDGLPDIEVNHLFEIAFEIDSDFDCFVGLIYNFKK